MLTEDAIEALKQFMKDIDENKSENEKLVNAPRMTTAQRNNSESYAIVQNKKDAPIKLKGEWDNTLDNERKALVVEIINCAKRAIVKFGDVIVDYSISGYIGFRKANSKRALFAKVYPQKKECKLSFNLNSKNSEKIRKLTRNQILLTGSDTKIKSRSRKGLGNWYSCTVDMRTIMSARDALILLFSSAYDKNLNIKDDTLSSSKPSKIYTSPNRKHLTLREAAYRKAQIAAAVVKREKQKNQHLIGKWVEHKQKNSEGVIVDYNYDYTNEKGYIYVQFNTKNEPMQFAYPESVENNTIYIESDVSKEKALLAREIINKKQENEILNKKDKKSSEPKVLIAGSNSTDWLNRFI